MAETYKVIETMASSEFTEQKSKFIGLAFPVSSEAEIKEILSRLRAEHPNANHVCYGYRLGQRYEHYRFSDDGEPGGTAGRPIFGQIEAFDVTEILVASVRYFGGIKLGTGGLVSNYQKSAKLTLENARIIEKSILAYVEFRYDYSVTNDVQKILYDFQAEIIATEFMEDCYCKIAIDVAQVASFIEVVDKVQGVMII